VIDWNAVILAFINGPGSSLAVMFLGLLALIFGLAAIRYARWSDREAHKAKAKDDRIKLIEQRLARVIEQKAIETSPTLSETYEGR
jgi:hypothetical protein